MALQQSSASQKLKLLVQLEEEEANKDYEQGKLLLELHQRSIPRSCWVRSLICRRKDLGQFDQLMRELADEDQEALMNLLRVTPKMYKELEQRLHERLEKQGTLFRNAFGILANRFQCLLTTLRQSPSTVRTMEQACVCLHNLMRTHYPCIHNSAVDGEDAEHT